AAHRGSHAGQLPAQARLDQPGRGQALADPQRHHPRGRAQGLRRGRHAADPAVSPRPDPALLRRPARLPDRRRARQDHGQGRAGGRARVDPLRQRAGRVGQHHQPFDRADRVAPRDIVYRRAPMDNFAARANAKTIPIVALTSKAYKDWHKRQPKATQAWLSSIDFKPEAGNIAPLPGRDGTLAKVVLGLGKPSSDPAKAVLWAYAALPGKLPKGRYEIEGELEASEANDAALGWALATYHFGRYQSKQKSFPTLVWPKRADRKAVERARNAVFLARDLVNTPAGDLGPAELAAEAAKVAGTHGAAITITVGEDLLAGNYPAIYAVGKGSPREPRLIDIRWGAEDAPKLTLVGKGVVFDTGGLDLKNSSGMK